MALEPMQGNRASSRVDLGYPELFRIPVVTSVSFSTCDSVLGASPEFHQANQCSLPVLWGIWNCSAHSAGGIGPHLSEMGKSHGFSRFAAGTWGIFSSLPRGWPFKTHVCSAMSGVLSNNEGHLSNIREAWQSNMDAS